MTSGSRRLILAFALIGLGFSSASAWVHYRLLTEPGYVSSCDVSSTISCSQAYLSTYGSVRGVPVALGGVAWFALVALIAGLAKVDGGKKPGAGAAATYVYLLAVPALAAVLYLGYASFFLLHAYCLLCMGTYVCVLGVLITSGLTMPFSASEVGGRVGKDLKAIFKRPRSRTAALLYVTSVALVVLWFPREMAPSSEPPPPVPAAEDAGFARAWAQMPRLDLGIDPGSARVVVVKFNDWLCPACKATAQYYEPVLAKYESRQPGAVTYVVMDWPWNAECNADLQQTLGGHQGSCDAAVAVRLARDAGREAAMVDWLFANQEALIQQGMAGEGAASRTIRAQVAEMLGITDFDRVREAKLQEVQRDVAQGMALQIASTPTYFVNGVRTTTVRTATDPGGQNLSPQYFDMAIAIELRRAGGGGSGGRD